MSNFAEILSFSVLPLIMVFSAALVTPGIGAVLALRNEIMLAIALPSVANAGIGLALLCGIRPEQIFLLYLVATAFTLTVVFTSISVRSSIRQRELRLAGLFAAGQILALLFSSVSTSAHGHTSYLLNGEVMASGKIETAIVVIFAISLLSGGVLARKQLFSWCADEDFFRIGIIRYRAFITILYTLMATVITIGVATVGSLAVTAFMVLPALLGDSGKGGISRYMVTVVIIGILGSMGGFLCALFFDLPPAVCAATGVGVLGFLYRVAGR